MIKTYKAHPLMIFTFIRPTLIVLFLPVIKAIEQYLTERNFEGVTGFSIIVVASILALAVLRWRSYKIEYNTETKILTVTYGFLFKSVTKLDINKLSSIQNTQNPIDYIFRSVTFKINTEAGAYNRTDFQFKLGLKKSKEFSVLLYGKTERKKVKYSAI